MSDEVAIKAEGISKCYRLGLKENIQDSMFRTALDFIRSPFKNYRKYRSLYRFEDLANDSGEASFPEAPDIVWAMKDVSFEVRRGEVLGVVGGNGAGKSTLLKILSRITDPTRGRAQIRGRVASLLEVGTGFHPELTGRENIFLNGTILGMTKKEVDRKFDEIVDFSGVEKFIDTPVKRYSSGMRVRLAFAVAAHMEPEILLIDEVLAVGDARFQKKCLSKMEDVRKEGRTILFVSHDMQAVGRLCKRAILMAEGRIVEDGPAEEVVRSYLTAGTGTSAVREWKDASTAPSGGVVRLWAVRVRNEKGDICEVVDIRKPVSIEMEYEVLKPGYVLLPHYEVRSEEGHHVFTTLDLDLTWRGKPRPAGRYIGSVTVPGNLLSEGNYYFDAWMITTNPSMFQFAARDAVSFSVVDSLEGDSARGDYAEKLPGIVRPLLNWTTSYSPNGA